MEHSEEDKEKVRKLLNKIVENMPPMDIIDWEKADEVYKSKIEEELNKCKVVDEDGNELKIKFQLL